MKKLKKTKLKKNKIQSLSNRELSKKDRELINQEENKNNTELEKHIKRVEEAEKGNYENLVGKKIIKAEISKHTNRIFCLDLDDGRTILIHYWNIEKNTNWRSNTKEKKVEPITIKKKIIKKENISNKESLLKKIIKKKLK